MTSPSPPPPPPPLLHPVPQQEPTLTENSPNSTGTRLARPTSVTIPNATSLSPSPSSPRPTGGAVGNPGPLSPTANISSNTFVFPIRSVFKGMDPPSGSDSTTPRSSSRGQEVPSPRIDPDRRFSLSFAEATENDGAFKTIHEMLERSQSGNESVNAGQAVAPAVATFTGRGGASSPPNHRKSNTSQYTFTNGHSATNETAERGPVHLLGRRSSDIDRPSNNIPNGDDNHSGVMDNERHSQTKSTEVSEQDPATGGSAKSKIQHPVPVVPNSSQRRLSTVHSRTSRTEIERDETGIQSLVNDFTGIVRLGEAGSLNMGQGSMESSVDAPRTATSSRSLRSKPSFTVESATSLSSQQAPSPRSRRDAVRSNVRDFVNEQALTVNMLDPNAPSKSPGPGSLGFNKTTQPDLNRDSANLQLSETSQPTKHDGEESDVMETNEDASDPSSESEEPIVTFRFEHIATEDGHHVVVGREGTLQRCEDEPITTPGAIQGFGVLVVLEENYDTGVLMVRQVSENSTEIIGLSPKYLFRLDCFSKILSNEQEDILRDNLDYLPEADADGQAMEDDGPQVFLLSGHGEPGSAHETEESNATDVNRRRREWTCWVAAHRPRQSLWNKVDDKGQPIPPPNLIVLEFELETDNMNPLMPPFETLNFSSGARTPDSTSDVSLGADSGLASKYAGSGAGSGSESMTVTTPMADELTQRGLSDGDSSVNSTIQLNGSGRASSFNLPHGAQPMGLEGMEIDHPIERIIESTTNHARPLRALERMRRTEINSDRETMGRRQRRPMRRQPPGSTGTMDVFAVLGQINDQLSAAPDLETFLNITVGVVQDLCQFHRVLIYQFDESMNGQVVTELVQWGKTTDLFKGLMFPAADIPAQARELYKTNKVRLLYDRSQTTARIVLRDEGDLETPLDMTHCYLRAMSPIHIKYLGNMHVRSSMSVSIMAFGQLWGLIACHSYGHHGMRVSFPVRQMMRILSDSISRNIERLSYAQRLHTRKLISTIPSQAHPTGYIVSNADDLLQIFDADSGLLVIGDGCKLLGNAEQGHAMLAIAEYLRIVQFDSIKASNCIIQDFPDLQLPRAHDTIAGLLYVPLTAKAGQDFIVFFRKGQIREVQWAGKPYKDETAGAAATLEPRKSFKTWSETVTGRARAWSDDQLESAGVLALIYGKFIQVWREKQNAMVSNQLTAILLSNTSHAVRTPLSQIINTLELALAGNIDADTRSMLENSHQASRALLFHVHDLLDLTRIETGNETTFNDPFNLKQTIAESVRLYQNETSRRGIEFKLDMSNDLPQMVVGDSRKIKTVVSNLVANSVKFTREGSIEVSCHLWADDDNVSVSSSRNRNFVPIEIVISDSGCGIPPEQLEAMFVSLEGAEELRSEGTFLGLGLAVVARIVEQLGGQLRAESEVNKGTRFYFKFNMEVYKGDQSNTGGSQGSLPNSVIRSRTRTASSGSNSVVSRGSLFSEIDSFVQDFGSSHMLAPVSSDDHRILEAEERMNRKGTFPVTDSSYPIRPSKVDTEVEKNSIASDHEVATEQSALPSRDLISPGDKKMLTAVETKGNKADDFSRRSKRGPNGQQQLRVMVVEDDIINSQILQKRLKMDKHSVIAVNNGQEAVDAINADWDIDVVLMDIQMPIMDGRTSAKEIRKLEAKIDSKAAHHHLDPLRVDGRIPIFAVSASLYENDRTNLMSDFDGWLLKPLDFKRVRALLSALENEDERKAEVYKAGHWERGGYFKSS